MSKIANCKVTLQCENRELAERIINVLEWFDKNLLFSTGITPNTREPFIDGVHLSLFYKLPEEKDNGSV